MRDAACPLSTRGGGHPGPGLSTQETVREGMKDSRPLVAPALAFPVPTMLTSGRAAAELAVECGRPPRWVRRAAAGPHRRARHQTAKVAGLITHAPKLTSWQRGAALSPEPAGVSLSAPRGAQHIQLRRAVAAGRGEKGRRTSAPPPPRKVGGPRLRRACRITRLCEARRAVREVGPCPDRADRRPRPRSTGSHQGES